MKVETTSPIIILGMHRSGTSCLAGTLENAGVNLGEVSNKNKFNLKGNKENSLIMKLNDEILKDNNGSWDSPPPKMNWNSTHIKNGNDIANHFTHNDYNKLWGFKDPRTLLTFDYWNSIFPNATLIGAIRSPSQVSLSLHNRDSQISFEKGLSLWLQYNSILLKLLKEKTFPLLSFDATSEEYENKTTALLKHLFPANLNTHEKVFFDNKLRSKTEVNKMKIPKEINDCYEELCTYL